MSKYLDKKLLIEEERDKIVENLEEAIISRSGSGITYTNMLGFTIMKKIYEFSNLKQGRGGSAFHSGIEFSHLQLNHTE